MRTGLDTAATGHASGQVVALLLLFCAFSCGPAPSSCVPSICTHADFLEGVEHALTIHHEIAHDGELGHRFEGDDLAFGGDGIDEGGASLTDTSVDDHGTGAADLLETRAIPNHGCDRPAVGSFFGSPWICWRAEMTFIWGSQGTLNSSQRRVSRRDRGRPGAGSEADESFSHIRSLCAADG